MKPGVSMTQATTNVNLVYQQILRGFPDAPLSQENAAGSGNTHVPLTPMATGLSSFEMSFRSR